MGESPRPDLGIEIRMFVFRDRDDRPKVTIGATDALGVELDLKRNANLDIVLDALDRTREVVGQHIVANELLAGLVNR